MSNRHQTTVEQQVVVLNPSMMLSDVDRVLGNRLLIESPRGSLSKWFDENAWKDYQDVIRAQSPQIIDLMENDPHSRRLIMYGPPGACWISTQWLSLPPTSRVMWHIVAYYRSLDADHVDVDRTFQMMLTDVLRAEDQMIGKLTMIVGSFHRYL